MKGQGHLTGTVIKTAHGCFPLPAPLLAHCFRLLAFFAPFVTDRGCVGQRKLIFKQQNGIPWTIQKFFLSFL